MHRRGENEPDYYTVLGVVAGASIGEITAAYHRLARKYHPDTTAGQVQADAKFKAVSRAYEVLSDAGRRRHYDHRRRQRQRAARHRRGAAQRWPRSPATRVGPAGPGFAPASRGLPSRPGDIHADLPIAPEEAIGGGPCELTLRVKSPCAACDGAAITSAGPCPHCAGTGETARATRIVVDIPAGAATGTVLFLPDLGHLSSSATHRGGLYLRLVIRPCW
jgi:molecular chaperone DnaJ